jgi:hypothetical protein
MSISEQSSVPSTKKRIELKTYKALNAKLKSYKDDKETVNDITFTDKLPSFDELTKI